MKGAVMKKGFSLILSANMVLTGMLSDFSVLTVNAETTAADSIAAENVSVADTVINPATESVPVLSSVSYRTSGEEQDEIYRYSIRTGEEVSLRTILYESGFLADSDIDSYLERITDISVSDPDLLHLTDDEEEYIFVAEESFDSEVEIILTTDDGVRSSLVITNVNKTPVQAVVVDDEKTGSIAITAAGEEHFDDDVSINVNFDENPDAFNAVKHSTVIYADYYSFFAVVNEGVSGGYDVSVVFPKTVKGNGYRLFHVSEEGVNELYGDVWTTGDEADPEAAGVSFHSDELGLFVLACLKDFTYEISSEPYQVSAASDDAVSFRDVLLASGVTDEENVDVFLSYVQEVSSETPEALRVDLTEDNCFVTPDAHFETADLYFVMSDGQTGTITVTDERPYEEPAEEPVTEEPAVEEPSAEGAGIEAAVSYPDAVEINSVTIAPTEDKLLPEDAESKADVVEGEEAINKVATEADDPSVETVTEYKVFDIDLENVDKTEYESFDVELNISKEAAISGGNFKLYHILEDGTYEEVPVTVNMTTDENGNEIVDTITFTTPSFSDFVLVYTVESYVRTASGETWKITASYDPDAGIPSNAQLYAEEITEEDDGYSSYVRQSAIELGTLASSVYARAFDIRLWNPDTGEIYQPGEKGVEIKVELQDSAFDKFEKFDVLHFSAEAETGTQKIDSSHEEKTVLFTADGFSTFVLCGYTVDFHWGDYTYSIEGESEILLTTLFEKLGITEINIGDVTDVKFSNPNYVDVTPSGNDWLLTSIGAFDTNETLTLSLTNGQNVVILVTDEDAKPHNPKISSFSGSAEGDIVTYTLIVEAQGDMDYETNGGSSYPVDIYHLNPSETSEMSFVSGTYYYSHAQNITDGEPPSTVNGAEAAEGAITEDPVTVNPMYDGDTITLTYKVKVTKGVFDNGNLKVTNTASIKNEGNSYNDSEDDSITIETSVPMDYSPLSREMTALEGSWATWTVTVNPYAFTLNNSAPLTLTDTFDDAEPGLAKQAIDYSSIQVSDLSTVYDYSGNTGTFTIPDSTAVTITYRTRITAVANQNATFQGTAVLKGNSGDIASSTATETQIIYPSASDVAGFGTSYMVKLYVYADGQMQSGLEGARFILLDANKRPIEYKIGDNKGEHVTFITDSTGHVNVELHEEDGDVLIEKNTVYYLEMIQTPEGYQKDNQLYSFMITDDPSYDSGGVYTYYNGDTLKIRLYPVTPGLRVSLRFSGNYELTEDEKNPVQAVLQEYDYHNTEWETIEYHTYSVAQRGAIAFDTSLEPGKKYRVTQDNLPWGLPYGVKVTSTYYCMINSGVSDPKTEPQEFEITSTDDSVNVVIENRYEEPKLTLIKMDKKTGKTLQRAVFTVKKAEDDTGVTSFMTDEDGLIEIIGGEPFEAETLYYIEETTAPTSYLIPLTSKKVYFYWCNDPYLIPSILADLPEGESAVNLSETYDSLTIDNQKETTTIPVMKTWQGNTWPSTVSSVVIGLYKSVDGAEPVSVTDGQGNPRTVTLTKSNPYNNTAFSNLPSRDENNKNITYSVKEEHVYQESEDIIGQYVQEYGVSDAGVYIVRNREATSLTVNKEWYDYAGIPVTDAAVLASQSNVTFDIYQSTSKIPADVREGGITNEGMTEFVSTLSKIREGLSFGYGEDWTMTISDLPKKDDLNNPYYYYAIETVPSVGDELYDANETDKVITIKNTIEPPTVSLIVEKARLVDDPREESVYRDFSFTLALNKGNHPIRSYTVYSQGDTELTTDWNGEVTFTLKPEHEIELTLPVGVTAAVTEAFEQEFTTTSSSETLTNMETEGGRIFRYEVTDGTGGGRIKFTNTLRAICMVVDKNGNAYPYESLKRALQYIRDYSGDAYVDGKATIQMLEDYVMPASDVFDVRESENIVLTTATTDTSQPFYFKTDRSENKDIAYMTRGDGTSSLLTNTGGVLTLDKILLDGANKNVAGNGGLVNSTGTLNIGEKTILQNSTVSGKGGAVYSSGTFNMPAGTITGNSASIGSAVYVEGTMNMTGGRIENNTGSADGAVTLTDQESRINLSGSPVIFGNTNANNETANLYNGTSNDNVIYVPNPGLDSDALIGVTAIGGHREIGEQFASCDVGVTANLNRFSNDIYGYMGKLKDGTHTNVVWDGLTLSVNKVVYPVGANPNDKFTIRISSLSIKKSKYTIDGTIDYTVTPAGNSIPGVIELRNVKADDNITISPLPVGSYTISETESNYNPDFSGEPVTVTDGVFTLDESSTVTVTNTRRLADVKLTKSLTDKLAGPDPVEFPFTVTLTEEDGTPVKNFTLADGIATDEDGKASFTMSPTVTTKFVMNFKAPVGAVMTVTEAENENYRVSASGKTMPAGAEETTITDEDTESDNVFRFHVTDDNARIEYKNDRKMAGIQLRKEVSGKVSENETFDFTVKLNNKDGSPAANYVLYRDEAHPENNITTDESGAAQISFVIGKGETSKDIQLSVPEGTKMVVEEALITKEIEEEEKEIYDTSYSINEGRSITSREATINSVSETDESIVFTNARKMRDITVTNTVSGYSGNVVPFTFVATVTDGNANDYNEHGFEDGVQTFELATGQSKVLTVPYGANLNIKEKFIVGYETTVKHGSGDEVVQSEDDFQVKEDVTVSFANKQLINIILDNKTSNELKNVALTFGYATKMYRVNAQGTGQDKVDPINGKFYVDVASGETAMLEVNHENSITAEQTYTVKGSTPEVGYYYTIQNEPSYHEFADPAFLRVYDKTAFEVRGKLRYSTSDATVMFSEQPLVSFDANGGAWTTEMEGYHDRDGNRQVYQFAVDAGKTVVKPNPGPVYPTDEDIPFLGWTKDEAFAKQSHTAEEDVSAHLYDFSTAVNAPLTLYAIWAKEAREERVVTVKNACTERLSVTVTLSKDGTATAYYEMADDVTTGNSGSAVFDLPAGSSKNLKTPDGSKLVLEIDKDAIGVSAQFTDADNEDKSFTIDNVARDGTVVFSPGICKITDSSGNILYDGDGEPAVYTTLEAAFTAYNVTLYTSSSHTDRAEQAAVKMLIDEYALTKKHTLPNKDVILTTAGKTDGNFPYVGIRDRSILYRDSGFVTDSLFAHSNASSVSLTEIILDGRNVAANKNFKGNLINVSNSSAVLNVDSDTTLRDAVFKAYDDGNNGRGGAIYANNGTVNVNAGLFSNLHARRGGAICAESKAVLNVTGTDGETRFENCSSNNEGGGAIYYNNNNQNAALTINGGESKDTPGIIFINCKAMSNGGNGGAIYATTNYVNNITIKGSSFIECSSKNQTGNQEDQGVGGGAICAQYIKDLSVEKCTFRDCDSLMGGGAVIALLKHDTNNEVKASIIDCSFDNCNCKGQGGGLAVYKASKGTRALPKLLVSNSTFNNCASGTTNGSGGAIQCYLPCVELSNSSFTDCWAGKEGGAFNHYFGGSYNDVWNGSYFTVDNNCRFIRCRAEDRYQADQPQHYGGAINTKAKIATIRNSYFEACVSTIREGGALHLGGVGNDSVATIETSTFINCMAKEEGGAILASNETLTITDSYFYGCSSFAESGGAVCHYRNSRGDTTQKYTNISRCVFSSVPNTEGSVSCSAAKDGGAIWTRANTSVNITDNIINGCIAGGKGGAVYQAANATSGAVYSGASIKNCQAAQGSAVYVADAASATFSGIEITQNTVATKDSGAAVQGGGNGSKLYFEGNVIVKDNKCSTDTDYDHDVLMQRNSTRDSDMTIIQTTSNGLGNQASVGVYVPDNIFERRGTEGKVFGQFGTGDGNVNLDSFFNDRDDNLFGYQLSTSNNYIYWGRYLCKITDEAGNTLKRANGKDAVYPRLTLALDDFTKVKDDSGQNSAVYIKMLVEDYPIQQNDTITNFPNANVTITTAGSNDEKHRYRGAEGTLCTIFRDSNSTGNNQFFLLNKKDATLQFENITLDGRKNKTGTEGNCRLIQADAGNLIINGGTTLQYGVASQKGGAIYINNTATLEINSSKNSNVVFDHCVQTNTDTSNTGGGAIYSVNTVTINRTDNLGKTLFTDCSGISGGAIMIDKNSADVNLTIDGAEFRNCHSLNEGGAVYVNNTNNDTAETTITNTRFENCYAEGSDQWAYGGAVNTKTAKLTVTDSQFVGCHAKSNGGAINHGSIEKDRVKTTITRTTFIGCSTTGTDVSSYGYGGSVSTYAKSVEMDGCTVRNSVSSNNGGGLYCESTIANAVITNTSFDRCSVERNTGFGGAVYSKGSAVTIKGTSKISNCTAPAYSGAIHMDKTVGTLTVSGNAVVEKCYANKGGAIYLNNGVTMNIAGSPEFTQNGYAMVSGTLEQADDGACIYLEQGSRLNISDSPKFSRNILPNRPRIVNGGITDNVRQDIYLAGYPSDDATSIHITGELTGDTIWVWPEDNLHRMPNDQFAITEVGVSEDSLSKFRNALDDNVTTCSNGEYLAGVRVMGYPQTKVYWDKMYGITFRKIDNKAVTVSGAEFTLYKNAECTEVVSVAHSADGEKDKNPQGELLEKGVVYFASIRIGVYYMLETKMPVSFRDNNTKYIVLVGTPNLQPTEYNKDLWENGGPLDVPNAATLVEHSTVDSGLYYGIFPLDENGKADLSENLAGAGNGVINIRSDYEAYFMKTDSAGDPLPNAAFTIYAQTKDAHGNPETYPNGYPKLEPWSRDGENYPEPVKSADGTSKYKKLDGTTVPKGVVYFSELPIGTYYLLETAYPVRNGNNRRSFYVESDRVLRLEVNGVEDFVLSELQSDGAYEKCSKDSRNYYLADNKEAVCKLTDSSGNLLYELGRDGTTRYPAVYASLEDGFNAAQSHVLYNNNGNVVADDTTNPALKLQALKDFSVTEEIVYNSPRDLIFTTAATTETTDDKYVFVTTRTSDVSRAEISRAFNGSPLITINGNSDMTLQNISLNGMKASHDGRAIHVTQGSLTIWNDTRLHDFKQTGENQKGGAILMDNGTELRIDGGSSRSAVFANNEVNGSGTADGGAVAIGENCIVNLSNLQFTGNRTTSATADAGRGGALYTASNASMLNGVFRNNTSNYGSAIYVENGTDSEHVVRVTIDSGIISGNRAGADNGGAVNVGGGSSQLHFQGNPRIFDNGSISNPGEQRNVVLSEDSNAIIWTTEKGLTGGKIGVYVIDGPGGTIFSNHGLQGKPFGTWLNTNNLNVFVNDRMLELYGGRNENDESDKLIYWQSDGIDISFLKTDGKGNALSGAEFSLFTDFACTKSYDDRKAESANGELLAQGTVLFERIPNGMYYMKETDIPDGYNNSYEKDANGNLIQNIYVVLVGDNMLTASTQEVAALGLTNADIQKQTIQGDTELKYAFFLLDSAGKARTDADIAKYGILNLSNETHKVVIRKRNNNGDTPTPLIGAEFTIQRRDMSYIINDPAAADPYKFTSLQNGVLYIGELSDGYYFLHETKAPDGYSQTGWFVVKVDSGGAKISALCANLPDNPDDLFN